MPIDRTVFNASTDDDGTGTSGNKLDKAWFEDAILDPVDDALDAVEGGGSPLTPPPPHAPSHQNGGTDEISVAGLSGLLADGQTPLAHKTSHQSGGSDAIKLDDLSAPDDNTDLNASTSAHGLLKKLSNVSTEFLNGQGNWAAPAGASVVGYVLALGQPGASDGPGDAVQYYVGMIGLQTIISPNTIPAVVPKTGTIKAVTLQVRVSGTLGSAETGTWTLRNETAATSAALTAVGHNATIQKATTTGLSLAVTAGDSITIGFLAPTWATNPTGVATMGWVYIE